MRDYKDYKPRRSVSKKPAGKRLAPGLFKAALGSVVIASLVFAAVYSYRWLLNSDYFDLKDIVVTGQKRVKREEIVDLSGARIGENILAMDLKGIAERIEKQPWIEVAAVRRVLPRGLSIEVQEREPFAILKTDRLYYLDRGGRPFKELDKGDSAGYPVITGLSREEIENEELARDAVLKSFDFMESEAEEWPQEMAISEIMLSKTQGITVLSNSIEVKIGFGDYKIKVGRLKRVLDDLRAKGRTARHIDLTYTGQVVVR